MYGLSAPISAVLFDLDCTLLDRTSSLKAFLADQHDRFAGRLGGASVEKWRDRFLQLDERGTVKKSEVYAALVDEFAGDPTAVDALSHDYEQRCHLYARPLPDMVETLQTLRSKGLKLGIITNGRTYFQTRHLQALGLPDLVDLVLISETEGLRKPDTRLFHRAASRLELDPARCLFVGDNPVADIHGAFGAGLQTAWFYGDGPDWPIDVAPNPGPSINRLPQILDLLALGHDQTSDIRKYPPAGHYPTWDNRSG